MLFVNDLFRAGLGRQAASSATDGTAPPSPIDISRRLRQPFLVPESRLVLDVLAEMRRQRRAFAVVVDEHGGVEGVLTVKDLLGALVGDLPDEFDPDEEPDVVRVDGTRWLVDGRISVDDLRGPAGHRPPRGRVRHPGRLPVRRLRPHPRGGRDPSTSAAGSSGSPRWTSAASPRWWSSGPAARPAGTGDAGRGRGTDRTAVG